jgi:hypothetical protein
LAYRKASRIERLSGLKADPQAPRRAAALAVLELRKDVSYIEAEAFASKALACVG